MIDFKCLKTKETFKILFISTYNLKNANQIFYKGARRDEDGYLWVTGRVDDMLNVSGHLMSTAEVESVLTEHPDVSEAAVVSRPHPIKGECLYCFVTPNSGVPFTPKLSSELIKKGYNLSNKINF